MTWVRIEPDAPLHPKIQAIGVDSFGFYCASLCYSNHYLTDGFIASKALLAVFPGLHAKTARRYAAILVKANLWEPTADGWRIHDFHKYQPTKEEVLDELRRKHDLSVIGGRARASMATRINGRFTASQSTSRPAGLPLDQPHQPAGPATNQPRSVPIRSDPKEEEHRALLLDGSIGVRKGQTNDPPVDQPTPPAEQLIAALASHMRPDSAPPPLRKLSRDEQLDALAHVNGLSPDQLRDAAHSLKRAADP